MHLLTYFVRTNKQTLLQQWAETAMQNKCGYFPAGKIILQLASNHFVIENLWMQIIFKLFK